ncbi:MAG TPA: Fe-S cluster assembly protein SufD [Solimonas sp.]|nr:Fe-S cluster assembly protein SufD [Solimonas sp.]
MLGLDHYLRAYEALPQAARSPVRRQALDAFLAQGFPSTDLEDWKYTDLAALSALEVDAAHLPQAEGFAPADYTDGLDALNAAFATGGLDQAVPAGADVKLVADGHGHRRHRLRLAPNSRAQLRIEASPDAPFQLVFVDVELDEGAQLDLLRLQDATPEAHRITRIRVRLARDAQLRAVSADFGGHLSRHDLNVELLGPGASAEVSGLFAPEGAGLIDNHTRIDHRAPHCRSRELFRGIASGKGRGVFNGKVVVHPGAQKTDSEQRVASLLLTAGAEINAKPELEIYADDVKCAHGATFGQLDQNAIFYLRTRGMSADAARTLLTYTFAHEVLVKIGPDDLRAAASRRFLQGLPGGQALEGLA